MPSTKSDFCNAPNPQLINLFLTKNPSYITNFGLSQDQIDRQFAIGKSLFALPTEEKLHYRADLEHGNYSGYRPLGSIEVFPGLRDNIEMYNVFKFTPQLTRSHPPVIEHHRAEIEAFQRHIAQDTVQKLLTLIALVLELPEDALTNGHNYDDVSDCHLRYMIYHARSAAENAKFQNVYSKGHTDFGSLTLLFRQPIAALQILAPDGSWKWVKPYPGSITVNIADVAAVLDERVFEVERASRGGAAGGSGAFGSVGVVVFFEAGA